MRCGLFSVLGVVTTVLLIPASARGEGIPDIIRALGEAAGEYEVAHASTMLIHEDLKIKKLETRKAELQHMRYVREFNFQWAVEGAELRQEFRQEMNALAGLDANHNEILTGRALNLLLDELSRRNEQTPLSTSRELNAEHLPFLNLTGPKAGSGHFGVLNRGKLIWPMYLRGEHLRLQREGVELLLARVMREAENGEGGDGYQALILAVNQLTQQVKQDPRKRLTDPTFSYYYWASANDYLKQLDQAILAIDRPNFRSYLQKLQAKTVVELVAEMKGRGARFGPATSGDEEAYLGVYRAMRDETIELRKLNRRESSVNPRVGNR